MSSTGSITVDDLGRGCGQVRSVNREKFEAIRPGATRNGHRDHSSLHRPNHRHSWLRTRHTASLQIVTDRSGGFGIHSFGRHHRRRPSSLVSRATNIAQSFRGSAAEDDEQRKQNDHRCQKDDFHRHASSIRLPARHRSDSVRIRSLGSVASRVT